MNTQNSLRAATDGAMDYNFNVYLIEC